MKTIPCLALQAFTQFVPGFGQVHGDPNNKQAVRPAVPVDYIPMLHSENKIALPENWATDDSAPATPASPPSNTPAYTLKHAGGPYWKISGPDLAEPEKIKGKTEAQVRMSELEDAYVAKQAEADADDGAPVA